MSFTFLEILSAQRILPPSGLWGWLLWMLLLGLTAFLAWRGGGRKNVWKPNDWVWLLLLGLLTPLSILIFTIRLPAVFALPIPEIGAPALGPLLPPLAALPWMFAALRFGPWPGALLGAFSGLLFSLWDTRSPFTPLEFALLGACFGALLLQSYRTRFFAWLRQPVGAALVLVILYPFLYLLTVFFWTGDNPLSSFDFALSRLTWVTFAAAIQIFLGAAILQYLRARKPDLNPPTELRRPAPSERSLEAHFLFTLGPIVLLAFLILGALGWWIAGRSAEQLLGERVASSTHIAADSVPFLLETGQNLILQLAGDTRLADPSPPDALGILQNHLDSVPYFEQLILVDTGGNTIASYPVANVADLQPGQEELSAVALAIQGVSLQFFSIPPLDQQSSAAQLSFVATVRNSNGQVRSVLIGRTSLSSNPFAQPILQSLQSINALGGQAYLLDGDGRFVIAPLPSALLQSYNGRVADSALSYEDVGPDGARRLVRYEPVTGSTWAVVAQWPARLSQQLAWNIAMPLLAVLLVLALGAYALLRLSLRSVTGSLQGLVTETRRIAAGDLEAEISVKGVDEVGRLATAFETMRRTLKARLEEIQRLLSVSQGVASGLEVRSHIDPILQAALANGASAARLIFNVEGVDGQKTIGFGKGRLSEKVQSLDSQILALTRDQERVLLSNPARARLKLEKGTPAPESLAAFALKDQGEQLGALWLAYDKPQTFEPDAVRYLQTLATQAAFAAANARLYVNAQSGRQRLEAALNTISHPVLVTDAARRVMFANLPALNALGVKNGFAAHAPLELALQKPELQALFQKSGGEASSDTQLDGGMYRVTVSPILREGELIGHVCQLRDVTQSKQMQTTRNEFLATVGHDLRDPLELIRGYVTMLSMVGELNPQQNAYVQKIEHSVANIARLAGNLLDVERLESGQGLQVEIFSLRDLIREVVDELEPRARQKKVEIVMQKLSGPESVLEADRTLLTRVFYNLLDNAIKFSQRNGVVEISSTFTKDAVTVAVNDKGPGIAPVDLPGLFDRGQKGAQSMSGLAIVKSIVQRHKGQVWVDSELGLGSSFACKLPLKQNQKPKAK